MGLHVSISKSTFSCKEQPFMCIKFKSYKLSGTSKQFQASEKYLLKEHNALTPSAN